MLSTLMTELSALSSTWKGLGAAAFEQVKSQYAPDLKTLNQALAETAEAIRTSGASYDATDTDAASRVAKTGGASPCRSDLRGENHANDGMLLVNFGALQQAGADIDKAHRALRTQLDELERAAAPLVETWEGEAQEAYGRARPVAGARPRT